MEIDANAATIVTAIVSALLGGGGVAAIIKARGENQLNLYQAAAERMAKLEARTDTLDKNNDDLILRNAELVGQISSVRLENESLNKRLEIQRTLIDELQSKVARLSSLEEENARLRQQLQIETSKREFLEREVNTLRQEIIQLRSQLEIKVA